MSLAARTEQELVQGNYLRGDPITGERYYSREFMRREWDQMWTRVWHIGALVSQLPDIGCVVTHSIGTESILMVRDDDQQIRAYYNVCQHRGNRLVHVEQKRVNRIVCNYHAWSFALNGVLANAPNPEDFPQGNPRGKVKLVELQCDTLGGFVWINMDPAAPSLRDSLGVVAEQLEAYRMDEMVRVVYLTGEADCNWKIIQDNFNESYHVQTLHRELTPFIEDSYLNTDFELYQSGHNRMLMKGAMPSSSTRNQSIQAPLDAIMLGWDLDPADFAERVPDIRRAMQLKKRELGAQRGYLHYAHLSDEQLTDYHHYTLFPNLSLTMTSDGFQVLRPQPHPTDPEKCLFDHWFFVPSVAGIDEVETPVGLRPVAPAVHEVFKQGEQSLGFVADQDLSIALDQQLGLHSRGYSDAFLSGQEMRVRRYHEVLNDYLEGRK